jgi:hypothetical protein
MIALYRVGQKVSYRGKAGVVKMKKRSPSYNCCLGKYATIDHQWLYYVKFDDAAKYGTAWHPCNEKELSI